jgi:nicotinamidase-related amidase
VQLNAKNTALVLIDLQKGVLAMPVVPHAAAAIYERSMLLAQRFRDAGALADAPRPPVDQPTDYSALPPGWDQFPDSPPPSDLLITKRQWSAFYGTELDLQLRRRAIRCMVLGGIATNIGVESTARSAVEHGYELVIPEDLCSGASVEMHAFSFKHILPRLARITSSEAISLG